MIWTKQKGQGLEIKFAGGFFHMGQTNECQM